LEIGRDFPAKLIGDELRVKQILKNLLSNAVKYTKEGTVTLSVSSSSAEAAASTEAGSSTDGEPSAKGVFLRFVVRDTGIGIRKEDMGKLFSGYTKLDTRVNRTIEGTGLGLEITKKLVEMMGGSITAESEYGKGSTFTVTFMQGLVNSALMGEKTAEDLRSFRYSVSRKEVDIIPSWMPYGKVLVVDDVPINIMVVEGLLEPYGLQVDTAASGKQAGEKVCAKSPPYDLVFMDHLMPEMDGIEAVKIIRAWEKEQKTKARIPIVALTANALAGNMEMFMSAGFDGFISKPINIVQVDEGLNKWGRDKQSPETLRQAEEARTGGMK
jgi:CheY-like chemotaxis protein